MRNELSQGLRFLLILGILAAPFASAEAGTKDRLFHRLRGLPLKATPYPLVRHLVLTFGRLEPKKASVFYNLGATKLIYPSEISNTNMAHLASRLIKVVDRSELSDFYKQKIAKQIAAAYLNYTNPISDGGPT